MSVQPPQETEHQQVLTHLASVVRRQKLVLIASLALVLAPVAYYNHTTPPVYEAATTLIFEEPASPVPVSTFDPSREIYIVNRLEEIQSLSFAMDLAQALPEEMLERFRFPAEPGADFDRVAYASKRIQKSIAAHPLRRSNIIRLRVQMTDPELCMAVANGASFVLQERNYRIRQEGVTDVRRFIEDQLERFNGQLQAAERSLRGFKEQNQITSFDVESQEVLRRLTEAEVMYNTSQADRGSAEKRLAVIRNALEDQKRDLVPTVTATATPTAQRLKETLVQLELQYTNFLVREYTPDHPKMTQLRQEIEETKRNLTQEAAKLASGEDVIDPIAQMEKNVAEALSLEVDIESLRAKETALRGIIDEYQQKLRSLPSKEFELARLIRERDVNHKIYMMLLEKREESRISEAEHLPIIRVIDPALLPSAPIAPRKKLNLALGLGLGLIAGMGVGLLREAMRGPLEVARDFEAMTGWPVVGWIPRLRKRRVARMPAPRTRRRSVTQRQMPARTQPPRLVTLQQPNSAAAEAFEMLRTHLELAGVGSRYRTLVITSAAPGDGKSTTLSNLAVSFATSGKRTLLIDAELRRPTIHSLFDIYKAPGLSDLLVATNGDGARGDGARKAGKEPGPAPLFANAADDMAGVAFQSTGVENLTILASGKRVANLNDAISPGPLKVLLDRITREYGVVLLDSAPIPLVHDTLVLCRIADAVLMVIDSSDYDKDMSRAAKGLLGRAEANVVGAVMNKVDVTRMYKSRYYRYYDSVD